MQNSVQLSEISTDDNDPHGYCINGSKTQLQGIIKRCILNKCICRIYHMIGLSCPIPHYDKTCILRMLNIIVKTRVSQQLPNGLQHVRRKLFLERRKRKAILPQKNITKHSGLVQFRIQRKCKSFKRIRRGYLNDARYLVKLEILAAIQRQFVTQTAERIESSIFNFNFYARSILEYYARRHQSQNIDPNSAKHWDTIVDPVLNTHIV